jgi:hypothetical protein
MRRGAISRQLSGLKADIAAAMSDEGVAAALSRRVALQLVFKIDERELGDRTVWRATARILLAEIAVVKDRLGLGPRQIASALPKLSAADLMSLFDELQRVDRRIARTILNAALHAADPLAAGRRYLSEYLGVARHVGAIDPRMARTLANASFTAALPQRKANEHLKQIGLVSSAFARLAALGVESDLTTTLANSSRFRGHLRNTEPSV